MTNKQRTIIFISAWNNCIYRPNTRYFNTTYSCRLPPFKRTDSKLPPPRFNASYISFALCVSKTHHFCCSEMEFRGQTRPAF